MGVQAVLGGTVAWHCENEPAPAAILAHHWPDVPNLGDITKVDWDAVESVDVLTGGFPCQDVSHAGKRGGMRDDIHIPAGEMACGCQWGDHNAETCEAASPSGSVPSRLAGDDAQRAVAELNALDLADPAGPPAARTISGTRSGLWTSMAYAVEMLRPALVVAENVRGLLSAEADSDVEPCPWCVGDGAGSPLRALGAVLGDLADLGYDARWCCVRAADVGAPHGRLRVFVLAQDAHLTTSGERGNAAPGQAEDGRAWADAGRRSGAHASDAAGDGWNEGGPEPAGLVRGSDAPQRSAATPDASGQRWAGCVEPCEDVELDGSEPPHTGAPRQVDWGLYTAAVRRWERVFGRPAPAPTEPGRKGQPRLSPHFVEWMMGLPAGHVCDVPGVSRNAQLRVLGNGVVPQQAELAVRRLLGVVS